MNFNIELTKTLRRQREIAQIAAIHAQLAPVQSWAAWITKQSGAAHSVVTVPENTTAWATGHCYVSVPDDELPYYLANGSQLVAAAEVAQ